MIAYVCCSVKSSCYIISCKGNSAYPHVGVGRLIMIRWRSFTNLLVGTTTHSRKQVTCKLKPGTYLVKKPSQFDPIGWSHPIPTTSFSESATWVFSSINYFPMWIIWWLLGSKGIHLHETWVTVGILRHIPNKYSQSSLLKAGFWRVSLWEWMILVWKPWKFVQEVQPFFNRKKFRVSPLQKK